MVRVILQREQLPGFTLIVLAVMAVVSSLNGGVVGKMTTWELVGGPLGLSLIACLLFSRKGTRFLSFVSELDKITLYFSAYFTFMLLQQGSLFVMYDVFSIIYLLLCLILAIWGGEKYDPSSEKKPLSYCKIFVFSLFLSPLIVYAAIAYEKNQENK